MRLSGLDSRLTFLWLLLSATGTNEPISCGLVSSVGSRSSLSSAYALISTPQTPVGADPRWLIDFDAVVVLVVLLQPIENMQHYQIPISDMFVSIFRASFHTTIISSSVGILFSPLDMLAVFWRPSVTVVACLSLHNELTHSAVKFASLPSCCVILILLNHP